MGLKDLSIATLFGKPEDAELPGNAGAGRGFSGAESSGSSTCTSPGSDSVRTSSRSSVNSTPPINLRASLPSSWYTSENFFGLEARAIFSQVCILF
jgi:hypothetical protein